MPKTPPIKKPAARKLGELLRAARGGRTQTELGDEVGLGKSSISRYESGDWVPDLDEARRLDTALGTGTLITQAVRDILFNPSPGVLDFVRTFSVFVCEPPQYVGPLYVRLAASQGVVRSVRVALRWGSKRRLAPLPVLDAGFAFLDERGFVVDEAGIALVFAKRGPGDVPLRVHTSVPLMLGHGCGLPLLDDDRVLDVNEGWTRDSHEIPTGPDPRSLFRRKPGLLRLDGGHHGRPQSKEIDLYALRSDAALRPQRAVPLAAAVPRPGA